MITRPYQKGQLFEYECHYCHEIVGGGKNVAPRSPCEHCGIFWGDVGPKVIPVGPPGAHIAGGITSIVSLERLLLLLRKVFGGEVDKPEEGE